jgi:hypothetical protein
MITLTASTHRSRQRDRARLVHAALCAMLVALAGCGDDDTPAPAADLGATDLGVDGGGRDDAGTPDGGAPNDDAGAPDGGVPDNDAGTPDDDAGTPVTDAGAPVTDAGAPDAGPTSCTMRPRTGCCFVDSDCTGPRERCVGSVCDASGEGVCKADPPGPDTCWDDKDCRAGTTCMSANICPCGAACFVADMPGVCVPTI